jgi:hypothetical protein
LVDPVVYCNTVKIMILSRYRPVTVTASLPLPSRYRYRYRYRIWLELPIVHHRGTPVLNRPSPSFTVYYRLSSISVERWGTMRDGSVKMMDGVSPWATMT